MVPGSPPNSPGLKPPDLPEQPEQAGNAPAHGPEHEPQHSPAQLRVPLPFISDAGQKPPRKRLFIGLVSGTALLLCLLLLLGWIIPYVGLGNIHPAVPYITGGLFFLLIGCVVWATLGLVLQILTGRAYWGAERVRGLTIKLLLPLMELLARVAGVAPGEVRRSFIKVNNQLALSHEGKVPAQRLLILLPHCVQNSSCRLRLTDTVDACARCGKCPVGGFLTLRDKYGVRLAVATGGSIARRIVVETRPKFIIAVACERDLAAGIQDTHPLPVFGILNHRPEGPCRNTCVNLDLVEVALKRFVQPSAEGAEGQE